MACARTVCTPISSWTRRRAVSSSLPISRPPDVSLHSSWDSRSLPIIGRHGFSSGTPSALASMWIVTSGGSPVAGIAAAVTVSPTAPGTVTSGTEATAYR